MVNKTQSLRVKITKICGCPEVLSLRSCRVLSVFVVSHFAGRLGLSEGLNFSCSGAGVDEPSLF